MPDKHSPLFAKLTALAAENPTFRDGARVISEHGKPPPLVALLAEIDNTVLERTLVFRVDNAVLRVAAAGRRLRSVIDITGAPDNALAGQMLSQDNPDMVNGICAFLAQLCKNAAQVTVQIMPATPIGSPSQAGISVKTLEAPADPATNALPDFLTPVADAVTANVQIVDGDITATSGQTAALEQIWRDQFDAFHNRQKAIFPQPDAPMLVCLDHALGQDKPAAIASIGNQVSVFAYDPARIGDIMTAWHSS